ncbi:hypothetical protein FLJC2902T_17400 [Flavobacterium limnosediminis JC2902]|uniref:Uncharacterized protein n=1 Tax=Flavobacterium limnosediminis JC2902 TaxID=1341181 RepID=V6SP36_9FLAO|nr:hypothetical protein FLJC2902T_17400 [Flavobacterium limnosediminis JC2902]
MFLVVLNGNVKTIKKENHYKIKIRQNPTKSDGIRQNPTESTGKHRNPTESVNLTFLRA